MDKYFSLYVRVRDDGKCITCGIQKPIEEMQAGHFNPRKKSLYTTFDEDNVHCQCYSCNVKLGGNLVEYAYQLPIRIGEERYAQLQERIHNAPPNFKIRYNEYQTMLALYRVKARDMIEKKFSNGNYGLLRKIELLTKYNLLKPNSEVDHGI